MSSYPNEILADGQLLMEIEEMFGTEELNTIARATRFIERSTSRLTGQSFLMLNVFQEGNAKETSLTDMCDSLEDWFGITMTKQSLDERYNTHAVSFMKQCFIKVLSSILFKPSPILENGAIKKIILTDATSFQLSEDLAIFYPGPGGTTSNAMVKIHQSYDLLSGQPIDIQIVEGRSNDNDYQFKEYFEQLTNYLHIRDLGYYDFDHFQKIENSNDYYLSRCKSNIKVFKESDGEHFESLEELFSSLSEQDQTRDICDVQVGKTKKLNTRLIVIRVPEQVAQQRLEKLMLKAKGNRKWNVSDQRKQACYYNVYMTNIPQEELCAQQIHAVYKLRWQIELMFKIWKSLMEIDKVKKMSIFRFECYLYGRMIAILLTAKIQNLFKTHLWEEDEFELSEWKSAKVIKKNGSS